MTELPIQKTFLDAQGIEIVYFEWPVAKPKAVVQLVHGLGEHANRYTEVITLLNRAGYSVYANDHRGHGLTGKKMLADGIIKKMGNCGPGGMRAIYAAEWQFSEIIKAENVGIPHILMGQSWGSFISQHVLNAHPKAFNAVVLTGTTLMVPGFINSGNFNKKFAQVANPTGFEWLSRERSVGEAFVADELTFPDEGATVWGPLNTLRIAGIPSKRIPNELPILILVGDDDPLGGERGATALMKQFRRAGVPDVELVIYHGGRHEMLNETNKDEVRADLINWLESVTS